MAASSTPPDVLIEEIVAAVLFGCEITEEAKTIFAGALDNFLHLLSRRLKEATLLAHRASSTPVDLVHALETTLGLKQDEVVKMLQSGLAECKGKRWTRISEKISKITKNTPDLTSGRHPLKLTTNPSNELFRGAEHHVRMPQHIPSHMPQLPPRYTYSRETPSKHTTPESRITKAEQRRNIEITLCKLWGVRVPCVGELSYLDTKRLQLLGSMDTSDARTRVGDEAQHDSAGDEEDYDEFTVNYETIRL